MPILFETVSQPSDQDWIDLVKVCRDFADPQQANWQEEQYREWIQQQLDQGDKLYAARFNARLIGMVWLTANDSPNSFDAQRLCVRQVTRQRGVAAKLLADLCNHADHQGWQLTAATDQIVAGRLLCRYGFQLQDDSRYLRQPSS